jgi:hypothetical protein
MLIIFCLFVTFVGIAVAALAVFGSQPIGTYLHIRATTDKTTDAAADTRLFATLLALSGELDVTMLSLRFSVAQTAALVEEWLDADSLRLVENILGTRVPRSYSSASPALDVAVCRLDQNLASCQTVCALIDLGPLDSNDRSKDNPAFVSLLRCAQKRLSRIPGRMKQERRIVADAQNDLAMAQRWMEAASVVLRCIPLTVRFADLRVSR